ncbi:uncharacterized protein LOC120084076 [Benincasa hispida]|uniref:uncharacterized protein LOC120084076 n=1 Tax=Benincasa hispida TaxID=102211 RepID=UPI0019001C44|nr:uncharacterized protein LOC120084076 [Benincasa hispida]
MKEVVLKEIMKLNEADIIYPIPDRFYQISIAQEDQKKTIITCTYRTYTFKGMPSMKDVPFEFDKECKKAFDTLKEKLNTTPILQPSRWNIPFKIMCDAINLAVEAEGGRNSVVDHLRRIVEEEDPTPVQEDFPDEYLFQITTSIPWYADIVNFLVTSNFPHDMPSSRKAKLRSDSKYFIWDPPYLWKIFSNQIFRRCVPDEEFESMSGSLSRNNEIPLNSILVCELVEAMPTRINNAAVVSEFLKANIFFIEALLRKYGVHHRVVTLYHPQMNGQAEISNQEVKIKIRNLETGKEYKVNGHLLKVINEGEVNLAHSSFVLT